MPEHLPAVQNNDTEISELAKDYTILNPAGAKEIHDINQDNLGPRGVVERQLFRIRVPAGGTISLITQGIDGEEMMREISFIALGWYDRRAYYKISYEQRGNQYMPPDCSSRDGYIGTGDPGGECPKCPLAKFGTDPKGGRGQACKETRQLMVLRAGHSLPEIVTIPATSLNNAKIYFQRLSDHKIPYWGLETSLKLERAQNADGIGYARMVFTTGRRLSQAERDTLLPFHQEMMRVLRDAPIEPDFDQQQDFTPPRGEFQSYAPPTDD